MKSFIFFVALVCATGALLVPAMPCAAQARTMNDAIVAASTIVVGRLDQYIPEPESVDRSVREKMRSSSGIAGGNVEMMVMTTLQPRGSYVFHVVSTVTGHAPQPLMMRFPRITSGGGILGGPMRDVPLKANYLLILNGDQTSGYTCPVRSPIPVGSSIDLPKEPVADDKIDAQISTVVQLIIDSLADPDTRASSAYFLRSMAGENVVKAMRPFVDDPDDGLRMSAITCLATNQDISVIPKIVNWKYNAPGTSGNPVTTELEKFKTVEAIPIFNQLIVDQTVSAPIRNMAAQALRQLPPDATSIPYWFKALHDPGTQAAPGPRGVPSGPGGMLTYHAYYSLHILIPELGPPKNVRDFGAVKDQEIKILDDWWADEQAGKHNK